MAERWIIAEELQVGDVIHVKSGKRHLPFRIESLTRTPKRGFVNVCYTNAAGTDRFHPRSYKLLLERA